MAIQRPRGTGEELGDAEQTITRNCDRLPLDALVAMHQRIGVVPNVVNCEFIGFSEKPVRRKAIWIDRCNEFHMRFTAGR